MTKKILLVDDSQLFYRFVKDVLKKEDIDIVWAKTMKEAIDKFKEKKPDLTLVDIILADSSGVEVIRKIKEVDPNANIVVISGLDKEYVIKEALDAGANDYIIKNTSISFFRQKVMGYLED